MTLFDSEDQRSRSQKPSRWQRHPHLCRGIADQGITTSPCWWPDQILEVRVPGHSRPKYVVAFVICQVVTQTQCSCELLACIACTPCIDAAYCYTSSHVVCLSVCSAHGRAGQKRMKWSRYYLWGRLNSSERRNHVLDGDPDYYLPHSYSI